MLSKSSKQWLGLVMTQLVDQLLPTPETLFTINCIVKDENKKRPGMTFINLILL